MPVLIAIQVLLPFSNRKAGNLSLLCFHQKTSTKLSTHSLVNKYLLGTVNRHSILNYETHILDKETDLNKLHISLQL